ncbi:acyltransferase family protein [Legionella gresilensis]|uniref:acyltransferase family protein n=1 Tax=Legionella gresilensis TaxID=91823 RepID=UPI0013EF615E|nr:acyltransferase [Legionella gresilensis]
MTMALILIMALCFTCFASITLYSYFIPGLNQTSYKEYKWLDGLRGVAACLVALNHIPFTNNTLALPSKLFYFSHDQYVLFTFFGAIAVQVFFCITGMLFTSKIISTSNIDWISFYKKRIRRLVPAYMLAGILAMIIAYLYVHPAKISLKVLISNLPSIFSFGLIPHAVINNFHFGRLLGMNWTLGIEWRFYLILPILFIGFQKWQKKAFVFLTIFALCDLITTRNSSWVYLLSGGLCSPLVFKRFSRQHRLLASAAIIVLLTIYLFTWNRWANFGLNRWLLMTSLFAALMISRPAVLEYKPLMLLGTVSYSFYLLHFMIIFFVFYFYYSSGLDITKLSITSFTILACFGMAIIIAVSCIAYLYVEFPFMCPTSKRKDNSIEITALKLNAA